MTFVTRRSMELGTAVAMAIFGGIVAADSVNHDIGWGETGPGAGYFPFRIGFMLVLVSAGIFIQALTKKDGELFASGDQLRLSFSVFAPTAVLVAAMFWLGCYVPSFLYLVWMMRRHGGYGWLRSGAISVAVIAAFFVVFELWFRVPLAKGPLEDILGIY